MNLSACVLVRVFPAQASIKHGVCRVWIAGKNNKSASKRCNIFRCPQRILFPDRYLLANIYVTGYARKAYAKKYEYLAKD
jgi:hypothetical protein